MTMIDVSKMTSAEISAFAGQLAAEMKAKEAAERTALVTRFAVAKAALNAKYDADLSALKTEIFGTRKPRAVRASVSADAVTYRNADGDVYTTGTPGRPPQWIVTARADGTLDGMVVTA